MFYGVKKYLKKFLTYEMGQIGCTILLEAQKAIVDFNFCIFTMRDQKDMKIFEVFFDHIGLPYLIFVQKYKYIYQLEYAYIITVKFRTVDWSTIQFWTILAKGHSI